jgi:hypothetical protein
MESAEGRTYILPRPALIRGRRAILSMVDPEYLLVFVTAVLASAEWASLIRGSDWFKGQKRRKRMSGYRSC